MLKHHRDDEDSIGCLVTRCHRCQLSCCGGRLLRYTVADVGRSSACYCAHGHNVHIWCGHVVYFINLGSARRAMHSMIEFQSKLQYIVYSFMMIQDHQFNVNLIKLAIDRQLPAIALLGSRLHFLATPARGKHGST